MATVTFSHQPIREDVESYEPTVADHVETGNALDAVLRSTQTPLSTVPHRSSTAVAGGKRTGDLLRQRPAVDQMDQSFIGDGGL